MSSPEREHAVDVAAGLMSASITTLYDVDSGRARTEDELTVMQVMIANAQATLAVAELLYSREAGAPW